MIREATTLDYIPIFQDNYIWVLQSPVERNVIAVDPGDATPLIEYLSKHQKTLQAIFITHHHADHTQGIAALKMRYQTPIYGPKTECIEGVTHAVQEGDVFHIASFPDAFTVLDIPGHTLGHIAYYFPGAVLCGDTLFSMGCGRLFEGTAEQMLHSLHKIAALPDDTKVYCTHEYTLKNLQFAARVLPDDTAIVEKLHQVMAIRAGNQPSLPTLLQDERRLNPFLRCHQPDLIARVEAHVGQKLSTPVAVFAALRAWKDSV